MSSDDERFMAFSGLLQWTQGVTFQAKKVSSATDELTNRAEQSQMGDF